jgi:hypothetical protein
MFSNERPSRPGWRPHGLQLKPPMEQNTLLRSEIAIERKEFVIALNENPRGRFVRVVERGGNRQASIIIPSTGLKDFQQLLAAMVKAEKEIPPKT